MVRRATVAALGLLLLLAAILPATAGAAPMARHFVTSFGSFQKPRSIAVDQSNGDIYVLDAGAKTISRFDKDLVAKKFSGLNSNVIDGVGTVLCTGAVSTSCDQTPFNGFSFDTNGGAQLAIDNSGSPLTNGDIYVTDSTHRIVTVFAPSGVYLGMLNKAGAAGAALNQVFGVAVDPAGVLYVSDSSSKVYKYVPTANPPTNADFLASLSTPTPAGLAVGIGPVAGSLFVAKRSGPAVKLNSAGALQYELSGALAQAVAVDPSSGHVFVATGAEVVEYDASGGAPVVVGSFGSSQVTTATGVAVDGTSGRVYVADATTGTINIYATPAAVGAPQVTLSPPSPLSASSVRLSGTVDPDGAKVSYYFEYGPADCATSACTSVPLGHDGVPAKGSGSLRAAQTVTGLQPETTYHYRLLATSAGGSATSPDATFSTLSPGSGGGSCPNGVRRAEQGSGTLPDCRAYELVSSFPAGRRNGVEILLNTERVRAAADGGAFQFSSFAGSEDIQGLPFTAEYMGVRDPLTGWNAHGLTPKQESGLATYVLNGREPAFRGFTPNLDQGIFFAAPLLNEEGPNVKSVYNLYQRDHLLTPGNGSYRLLTDAVTPQETFEPNQTDGEDFMWPRFVGASTDLSHIVFESRRSLTAEAATLPAGQRLYESVGGTLRLVGVLPTSEGGGLTLARNGQGYSSYSPHAVSADGSRISFTTPPFFNGETGGRLYIRDDHGTADPGDDTSVKVSASEKTNGAGAGGVDARGTLPALYADASVDMDTVFFRSTEALTNDAPEDSAFKLYRFRLEAPVGTRLTLISVDHNPADGVEDGSDGTIGASEDGSYVYFVSSNQLVADRPPGVGPRIYLWHAGTIRQVGSIEAGDELKRMIGAGTNPWQDGGRWARVSPDGKHLVYVSEGGAEPSGFDHGSGCAAGNPVRCRQVYLYSAPEAAGGERLQCASCGSLGQAPHSDADFNERDESTTFAYIVVGNPYLNHPLTPDGRFVFFTSAEQLTLSDENGKPDVYEFDSATGKVSLLSGARPGAYSYFLDASPDGSDVFFVTRSQLLGRDGDEITDVYDARIGGGFVEPVPPPPVCDSTAACRPAAAAAPATPDPQSLQPPLAVKPKAHHKRRHRGKKHKARHRGQRRGARHG